MQTKKAKPLYLTNTDGICPACGKPYVYVGVGDPVSDLENYCTCWKDWSKQPAMPGLTGWICPKCGAGVSPLTSVCPCNMVMKVTWSGG